MVKLRSSNRFTQALIALALGALLLFLPSKVSAAGPQATTCDGTLAPGTYQSIVVPAGATCDAGIGPITVRAGITVGAGGTFILGFEGGPATGTIGGGVRAQNAAQVLIHNAVIMGGVMVQGGAGAFGCAEPYGGVCATDFEDNTISGGVTINGYDGFWLGFIRNTVNGTTTLTNNNQFMDEIDIGSNTVNGNLNCSGNTPLENTGESPGVNNVATGHMTCNEAAAG